MDKNIKICYNCGEKHCCHGICKEMNDYLVEKNKIDGKNNIKIKNERW